MATEEQLLHETRISYLYGGFRWRAGQRLTISDRLVTKLALYLSRTGTPTGDVTLTIRKVSDDALINSKVWGDAGDLPLTATLEEVTFDTPVTVNEEVRILAEYSGGEMNTMVNVYGNEGDVKADEVWTHYGGSYTDFSTYDAGYIYTYEEEKPAAGGGPASLIAAGII